MSRALAVLVVVVFAGCQPAEEPSQPRSDAGSSAGMGGGSGGYGSSSSGGGSSTGGGSGASSATSTGPGPGTATVQPGTLTAGVWDDNANFTRFLSYRDGLQQPPGMPPFTDAEQRAAHLASQQRGAASALDIALVIDTTGSMGDEIQYLQKELGALAATLATRFPGVTQRWALLAYRDIGDTYVVRAWDFRTDLGLVQGDLDTLSPGGGGDFPEAPDQALAQAATLSWSTTPATAKVVLWVADAPPHAANAGPFATAVRDLASQEVRLFPIASSGIDEVTEYTMRAAAQRTGGRYLFLTDDSGVGGAHKEPTVSCYVVTQLLYALERVLDAEPHRPGAHPRPRARAALRGRAAERRVHAGGRRHGSGLLNIRSPRAESRGNPRQLVPKGTAAQGFVTNGPGVPRLRSGRAGGARYLEQPPQ